MKVILDANVVIAAFAARGLCESVLELCLHGHEIMLSEGLLDEILINLRRKIRLPASVVSEIGEFLREHSSMFDPASLPSDLCRDPDDVKLLGLAVSGNADYLVTGDKDLLVLNEFRGTPIITPRAFSNILHKNI